MFPLDLPHAGDRYLESVWALSYDVGYFAEPMVAYRIHDANIMKSLKRSGMVMSDLLRCHTRVCSKAKAAGQRWAVKEWRRNMANMYVFFLLSHQFGTSEHQMSFEDFEESLCEHVRSGEDRQRIRARVYAGIGDGCYRMQRLDMAHRFYMSAVHQQRFMPWVWAKCALLHAGEMGNAFRRLLAYRHALRRQRV
jgi:hypothetical protein